MLNDKTGPEETIGVCCGCFEWGEVKACRFLEGPVMALFSHQKTGSCSLKLRLLKCFEV